MLLVNKLRKDGDWLFRYRSFLPVLIIFPAIYLYVKGATYGFDFIEEYRLELIGLAVSLFGLIIRFLCVGYSADNTSGRNTSEGQIADSVNTKGMYSMCRHPLYFGNFFMWFGIAIFTQHLWFLLVFILVFWIYYERIFYAEEAFLTEKFKDVYQSWGAKTPTFIPNLAKWESPSSSFSWKKVLRQEKAGILNLFLVIYVLKLLREYFQTGTLAFEMDFWLNGLLAVFAFYLIIKGLQKFTKIF